MKAAAPQALFPPAVQKKATAGPAADRALRPARSSGELFSRIVSAKLHAEQARATRTKSADGAGVHTPGSDGAQGVKLHGQATDVEREAMPSAKRRAARGRGPAGEQALETGLPAAVGLRESAATTSAHRPDARAALEATPAAPAARLGTQPRVFVLDLRRGQGQEGSEAKAAIQGQSSARETDAQQGGLAAGVRAAADRGPSAPGREGWAGRSRAADASAPFESALERLRGMAGSELVKTSGIILRDGGGEIRLVLKPESLGSIRIRMNIVDNGIEGRIVVDSAAVKQVLDASIDALTKALTAQGFQSASLEVAVGGQNADGGRQAEQPQPGRTWQSAEGFERNVPGIESLSLGDLLVNLFV